MTSIKTSEPLSSEPTVPVVHSHTGRARTIILMSITTVTLITLLCGYIIWSDYKTRILRAQSNTEFTANLVSAQSTASLKALEKLLLGMENELQISSYDIQRPFSPPIHHYLSEKQTLYSELMDLLILDASGRIIHWTGNTPKIPDVRDRQYTLQHLQNPDSSLFIGEPKLSKVHQNQWFFDLSIPIRDSSGKLLRIYVAIIDIKQFITQFNHINLPPESTVGIITNSGNLITRLPGHDQFVGKNLPGLDNLWERQDQGNYEIKSRLDGHQRIVGYRLSREFDLATFSSTSRDKVLYDWVILIRIVGAILVFVVMITAYLTRRILRYQGTVNRQQQQLFALATTDALTGVYNRRYCLDLLQIEVIRSRRYQNPLSFLMIDIDHFKRVNDNYGHIAGDKALKKIASILKSTCREGDIVCRYGGEEFFMVLPETALVEAAGLAERLRSLTEQSSLDIGNKMLSLTISIGVSSFSHLDELEGLEQIINEADQAMYHAKSNGRNRVFMNTAVPSTQKTA